MKDHDAHTALTLASETLSLILSAHLAVVTALLASGEKCGAKVLRAAREIGCTVRRQLKIQHVLLSQKLRADFDASPAMRARIASDLGGTFALVRWERRKRGAKVHQQFLAARRAQGLGIPQDRINSNAPSASPQNHSFNSQHASGAKPRKTWEPKTDRTGNFRLATIQTGSGQRKANKRKVTTRIVKISRRASSLFQPIEVTASQLRRPAFPASNYGSTPPDIGMPLAGASPPIDRWPRG